MIAIIDYGLGNLKAFKNCLDNKNIKNDIVNHPNDLKGYKKIILPGVGNFDKAMKLLKDKNFLKFLNEEVILKKKLIMTVCVSMQILCKNSDEGFENGMSWVNGSVKKINIEDTKNFKLPHMGWNNLKIEQEDPILKGINEKDYFYFLHSYFLKINDDTKILAKTNYVEDFPAIIRNNNIYACQFHPEKSHECGSKILENFSKL